MNLDESEDNHCFVDDVDALTLRLAKEVIQRAISLQMSTYSTTGVNNYSGQAGIVGANLVTAIHNISSGIMDGVLQTTHSV
jgi:hypothetical protein